MEQTFTVEQIAAKIQKCKQAVADGILTEDEYNRYLDALDLVFDEAFVLTAWSLATLS